MYHSSSHTKTLHSTHRMYLLVSRFFRIDSYYFLMQQLTFRRKLPPIFTMVYCSAYFSTVKMEVICSSKMSVHTISIRRHIPEDGILHSYRCGNIKFYTAIQYVTCSSIVEETCCFKVFVFAEVPQPFLFAFMNIIADVIVLGSTAYLGFISLNTNEI
jgi:hypothetical protein